MFKTDNSFQAALPVDLATFGFAQREKNGERTVKFRCGRDFLYYALHYYKPAVYNPQDLPPKKIEDERLFGMKLPWWLMWTSLQFIRLFPLLRGEGLDLSINGKAIQNWPAFFLCFVAPRRITAEKAMSIVEHSIDRGEVSGIDISLGLFGLVDHVMFVFAYDADYLYVFDTQKLEKLEYIKITPDDDQRFVLKLPREVIKKRWTHFGRVWTIARTEKR